MGKLKIFLILSLLFVCSLPAYADTSVSGAITTDTTWTLAGSPYVVTSTVYVYGTAATPATLTIEPGVTVKFASNAGLQVGSGSNLGSLVARGTASERIIFTRNSASGTWGGINFQDATLDETSAIEHADIRFSGRLKVYSSSPLIRNVTISDCTDYGIYLNSATPILYTVAITNSGTYGIYLSSSNPTITGCTITNTHAAGYGIYGSGSPVISDSTINITNTAGKYGLYLSSTTSALSVSNSTIANGLYLGSTGITPTITGNSFTNTDNSPLRAGANIIAQILNNNTFNGLTSAGSIEVTGEQINQDTLWKKLIAPYIIVSGNVSVHKDTATPATLTIEPGTVVKFASSSGLRIGNGASLGSLIARGTASERITFTRNSSTGTWSGITFYDGTVDETAVVENVDISYASGLTLSSASPVFRNCTISALADYVNLSNSNPTLDNVTISNNGSYGISLSSSSPTITGGSLTNTSPTGFGIRGSGSPVISSYSVSIANSSEKYGLYLTSTTSALSVTNSTISNGLYLGSTGITPTITGNSFTNTDNSPLRAGANIITQILDSNTFNGLSSAGRIEVTGEQINQDTLWKKLAAPYHVVSGTIIVHKDTTTPATLTIEPGAVIRFGTNAGLQVGNATSQGALVVRGTASDRITLTRIGETGTWSGITFQNGTVDSTSIIEHAEMSYGGGVSMSSASPVLKNCSIIDVAGNGLSLSSSNPTLDNVTISNNGSYGISLSSSSPTITGGSLTNTSPTGFGIRGSGSPVISSYSVSIANSSEKYGLYLTSTTSALSVTNSTISNGLYLGSTGITPAITGNTFTVSANTPPHAGAGIINTILSANTFEGLSSVGVIEVTGEQLPGDTLWRKWPVPYLVSGAVYVYKDATTPTTLTVEPGTTVKFATDGEIQVNYKGMLKADALGGNPIIFTSGQATPSAGNWRGITLNREASSVSILNNVIIEYAGYGGNYSNANLRLSSSSPIIRNCIIRSSAGSGIYLSSASSLPRITNCDIQENKWGVYSINSNPVISNSRIRNNTTAGVWNATSNIDIDARNNWWGSDSGPYHTDNPTGTGNSVSDRVLYSPWTGQESGEGLTFGNVKVAPGSFNPEGDNVAFSATISAPANWTITITDSGTNVVRTFSGTGSSINLRWYGEDSQSAKVADGSYSYTIEAVNPETSETAPPLHGVVTAGRQLPIALIETPADNQILSGGSVLNITGTATDTIDFKKYTIDYGLGDNPVSWTTLKNSSTAVQNALLYSWNLTNITGGVYTIRLTVTDNAGNIAVSTTRIRLLWIQNATVTEDHISPNGDTIKDSTLFNAAASYPVNWNVAISNAQGTQVRNFSSSGETFTQAWDGNNNAGVLVPDGPYSYRIDAIDPDSSISAVSKTGTITVDTTMPVASIVEPASGAVLRNTVSVTGSASDANLDNFTVEYGPAGGSGPWSVLATANTGVSNDVLTTWVTNDLGKNAPYQNGDYLLRLTTSDKAGNTSTATVPVSIDNLLLTDVTASSHTLDTYANQTATVSFSINKPATVTFKIVPEKLGPAGTPAYQTTLNCATAGPYSFTWDGKNTAGTVVPDEAYLYILDASDGTRTDGYAPTAPTGAGSISCSQATGFEPAKNLPMTVTYTLAQPLRVNINITWGVFRYTVLDAFPAVSGSHTFDWDGRSPDNKLLDTDARLYRCSVASFLPENYIITTGDTVKVVGLKTDPYALHLAYGQPTRITYTLSRAAIVTLKLISPSGATFMLIDNQLQAPGLQGIEWNGMDVADTTGRKTLITEKGDFMVAVQAVNPETGTNSTTRANLRIGY